MSEPNELLELPAAEPEEQPPAEEAVPPGPSLPPQVVDLNTATVEELMSLPGIGRKLAERIIEYRETVHPFEELIELTAVPGISEATYQRLREQITVSPPEGPAWLEEEGPLPGLEPPPEVEPEPLPPLETAPPPEAEPEPAPPPPVPHPPAERPPIYERVIEKRTGWLGVIIAALLGGLLGFSLSLLSLWALNGTLDFDRSAAINNLSRENRELQQQMSDLGRGLDSLAGQAGELEGRLTALDGQLGALGGGLKQAQEALTQTQGQLDRLAAALGETNTNVDQIGQVVGNLQATVDQMGGQVKVVGEQVKAIGEQVGALQAESGQFTAFLDGLRNLLNRLEPQAQETKTPTRPTVTPWPTPTPLPTPKP